MAFCGLSGTCPHNLSFSDGRFARVNNEQYHFMSSCQSPSEEEDWGLQDSAAPLTASKCLVRVQIVVHNVLADLELEMVAI